LVKGIEEPQVQETSSVDVRSTGVLGGNTIKELASAVQSLAGGSPRIGFEEDAVSFETYSAWRAALPDVKLVPATRLINRLRAVKDRGEIEDIRAACQVSDLAMSAAVDAIKRGEPEHAAAAAAESVMRKHVMSFGFEPLIGSGRRSGLFRRYPGDVKPGPQDIVRLDMGARRSYATGYGYHSDMCRCLTPAVPEDRALTQLQLNLAVQQSTIAAVKPGKSIAEVSREGLRPVHGTPYEHATTMDGHGVGLDLHEWPPFNEFTNELLVPGMVLAIEPMLTIPAVQTTCFEDVVLVTETGSERLTRLPGALWTL